MTARILLADDHEVVRHGLRQLIEERPGWHVVGEAAGGREAVALAREHRPDIAILDYSMPGLTGLEATRQIRASLPRTHVLILTMHSSETLVRELLAAGARGYVLKSDAGRLLAQGIETVLRNEPFFTPAVSEMLLRQYLDEAESDEATETRQTLTPREREILQLIAEGSSTKEIAKVLGISTKTAETHRSNLMRKLQCRSVSDIVRYAIRNRIIEA